MFQRHSTKVFVFVILLTLAATGCGGATVSGSGEGSSEEAVGAPALGGVDLAAYCVAEGFADVTLIGPQVAPEAAYNWRCTGEDGSQSDIDMVSVCASQYSTSAVAARPTDVNDAYTWVCYEAP